MNAFKHWLFKTIGWLMEIPVNDHCPHCGHDVVVWVRGAGVRKIWVAKPIEQKEPQTRAQRRRAVRGAWEEIL